MVKKRPTSTEAFRGVCLVLPLAFLLLFGVVYAQDWAETTGGADRAAIETELKDLQRELYAAGHRFRVGYNPAMKFSIDQLCGLVEPKGWRQSVPFEDLEAYTTDLPSSWDWREWGGKTPVRNQGGCGSCWAFATVAPLEILINRDCQRQEDLSEQYLVSCNDNRWSCSGGWFAHPYHMNAYSPSKGELEAGAVLEGDFPYTATNEPCNGPHRHPYKIDSWGYIAGQSSVPSDLALKQAIYNYGPVAAAVCVGKAFQGYVGGIFTANETCSGNVNHAITLVGWNDDGGYWILKNSWGTGWGEGGYMRIKYGTSKVGYGANYIQFSQCGTPPEPIYADLSGQWTSVRSSSGGKKINATLKVSNTGKVNAGAFKVAYYLSSNGQAGGTPILTGSVTSGLAAGKYINLSISYSSRTSLSKKYLVASIDYLGAVVESNEGNNVIAVQIP